MAYMTSWFYTLVTLFINVTPCSTYVSFCYFTSWSINRPNPSARISIDKIDAGLCTHLLYAFGKINQNTKSIVAANPYQEYGQGGLYAQFNQLKQRNPSLKTLLSVGGESSSWPFAQISRSAYSIDQFSRNTAAFLRRYGFDGLDVDWEFPDQTTKFQYSALLKGLREEFDRAPRDGQPLILTATVSAGEPTIKAGYNIPELTRYLDYISIMTYDFSGSWNQVTGFNSPLMGRDDPRFSPLYNVDYAVNLWIKGGSDRQKIVLGMTGAGASFSLSNSSYHGVGAPVSGGGPPGEIYQLPGRLVYPEICKDLKSGWTRVWDEKQQVPYAYSGNNWVGYDDPQSVKQKVLYAVKHQLGGVMFWELSFDDPQSICNQGKFPLLNVVKETFNVNVDVTTLLPTPGITYRGLNYVRFCYFTSWSINRPNPSTKISIDKIDASLCTHLLYAFGKINQNTKSIVAANPSQEYRQGGLYAQLNQLKQRNPSLKTLLSVGGESSSWPFAQISRSADSIAQFSRNTAAFLRRYGFDGLDVDWEFPDHTTKFQYSALLKGLRAEFNRASRDGKPLMLTAAVSAGEPIIKAGYNIPEVSRYLDYISIMLFDFSGSWSQVTGFNSPLMARNDPRFSQIYNVDYAVKLWINEGSDRRKIVLGMTGAGASFILSNSNNHGVGAPVIRGGGPAGELYQLRGRLIYPEICKALNNGWTRVWDTQQKVPYAYSGNNWVGYDDAQSIKEKALYAMEQQLGGVMFWELSFDDPKNICNQGKFPLLNAVKETFNLNADVMTAGATQSTTTGTTQGTATGTTKGRTTGTTKGTTTGTTKGTTTGTTKGMTTSTTKGMTTSASEGTATGTTNEMTTGTTKGMTTSASEGTATGTTNEMTTGTTKGMTTSASKGTTTGAIQGTATDATQATTTGTTQGTATGTTKGTTTGASKGTVTDATHGTATDATQATTTGATQGTVTDATQGNAKGSTQGTATGAAQGTAIQSLGEDTTTDPNISASKSIGDRSLLLLCFCGLSFSIMVPALRHK